MNLREGISADELTRLYLDEGLTIEEIAAQFGLSATSVRRRMDELGIAARSRGPFVSHAASFDWSPELAYVVGLITTDGNLSGDSRHLAIISKDVDLLETVRICLNLSSPITHNPPGGFSIRSVYRLQWSNRVFHDWLVSIGLMPAKSLRLGPLVIPDEYLADFFRGCIDGDGSIVTYTDTYNTFKSDDYVYERLFVALASGSRPFLEWLQLRLGRLLGVSGGLSKSQSNCWVLKYMKRDSIHLLKWMYYAPDVPCLARKRDKALLFLRQTD